MTGLKTVHQNPLAEFGLVTISGTAQFPPYFSVTSITGSNLLAFGNFYSCGDSSASTQTLPLATGSNGSITIENTGIGSLTVAAQTSQTINGASSQILGQYASITVRDYASGKWIIMY